MRKITVLLAVLSLFLIACEVDLTDKEINELSSEERRVILEESTSDSAIAGEALSSGVAKRFSSRTISKIALKEINLKKDTDIPSYVRYIKSCSSDSECQSGHCVTAQSSIGFYYKDGRYSRGRDVSSGSKE